MIDEPVKHDIEKMLKQRKWGDLQALLATKPVPEIADLLLEMDKSDRVLLFRLLPRKLASAVFSELDSGEEDALLKALTDEETRQLLAHIAPDDRTQLLEELPGQATQRLLNLLSPEDLREARLLLGYPEESIGRLMTPDYVAVRLNWTIGQAIERIRVKGKAVETISVIYVTDASWKLLDALELQRFILADPDDRVETIMDYSFVELSAYDDREKAVDAMQRYDLFSLPVVDSEGVLLGVVTVDDVMDVAQEEATEDFHRVAAVAPLKTSYREAGVWSLYRKRILWLFILIFVNLVSSSVIAAYEQTLAAAISLAFFIPLLIDSGGNAGSQSATMMVRALATGDIQLTQWFRTFVKEIGVGITLGLTMGLAGMVLGAFRGGAQIGFIVGATMVAIVLLANLIGVTLPFLFIRLRIDPAVASSPLITTIADATGLFVYFSIATWVFRISGPL